MNDTQENAKSAMRAWEKYLEENPNPQNPYILFLNGYKAHAGNLEVAQDVAQLSLANSEEYQKMYWAAKEEIEESDAIIKTLREKLHKAKEFATAILEMIGLTYTELPPSAICDESDNPLIESFAEKLKRIPISDPDVKEEAKVGAMPHQNFRCEQVPVKQPEKKEELKKPSTIQVTHKEETAIAIRNIYQQAHPFWKFDLESSQSGYLVMVYGEDKLFMGYI